MSYTQLELKLLDMLETIADDVYQCPLCGGFPRDIGDHLPECKLIKVLEETT